MARRSGVEIEGLGRLNSALDRLAWGMTVGASDGQETAASAIAEDWRDTVPVETGEYRDSIDYDDESAFATSEHAPFPEFGTSTQPAQPAGTFAAATGRAKMPKQVADAVKRRLP